MDGVAPSRMVGVSASVNLPLHHKVQKFSSGTGSLGWSQKRAVKPLWWWWCGSNAAFSQITFDHLLLPDNNSQIAVCKAACGVTVICMH